jgi:hypothetical protein
VKLLRVVVACAALALTALAGDTPSAWALSPPPDGPRLAFTQLVAELDEARYVTLGGSLGLVAARDDPSGFVASDAQTP